MLFNSFIIIPLFLTSFIIATPLRHSITELHRKTRNTIDSDLSEIFKPEIISLVPSDGSDGFEAGQCMFVKSEEGTYSFVSTGSSSVVCGLYIIAEPDQLVEFEFEEFDVSCSKGGLLSVIDGWELNGQFFPSTEDHPIPRHQRYQEYCGVVKPWKPFRMHQNAGLLEFRIPTCGDGFTVRVRFIQNPKPCNALLQNSQGIYTIRNYGRRINCTISVIFPETFRMLASSVGEHNREGSVTLNEDTNFETGIIRKCKEHGMEDYVEFLGGGGLDPHLMTPVEDLCGVDSRPSKHKVDIMCENTAVRLISSGKHDNSVTLAFDLLLDWTSPTHTCPSMLNMLICE